MSLSTKGIQGRIGRRQLLAAGATAAAAAGMPALGSRAYAESSVLRVRIGADIGNVDPARIFQIENQTIAGHIYSGCVRATAIDAISGGFRPIVPKDCVADRAPLSHTVNLFDMDSK